MTLQELIDVIAMKQKIDISVEDLMGVLSENEKLKLGMKYRAPACEFCSTAKKSEVGYHCCMSHRKKVSLYASWLKKSFCGKCPYGISGLVYPVVRKEQVLCIIYIGNLCPDRPESEKCILEQEKRIGIPAKPLLDLLSACEAELPDTYRMMAALIADFILENIPADNLADPHWAVSKAIEYSSQYYMQNIHLRQIAELCHISEKYLGRIFKRQTGMGFREYLMDLRLKQAAKLLRTTGKSMTDIALSCGFEEVTYFNHVFRRCYGCSPTVFRRKGRGRLPVRKEYQLHEDSHDRAR